MSVNVTVNSALKHRAKRALARQLGYQRNKAAAIKGHELDVLADMIAHATSVREKIERVLPIHPTTRVLEVGCGAHGLIFFLGAKNSIGIDPLAYHYARLFPLWYGNVPTVVANGESLPFAANSFDLVLCDNVVDHAERPRQIIQEIDRVLAPQGVIYFTVNVHHPFYHLASSIHATWQALGIPLEITPFADHTVHLTIRAARQLFTGLEISIIKEGDNIVDVKGRSSKVHIRHTGDNLKRVFFKNARYEVIAVKR